MGQLIPKPNELRPRTCNWVRASDKFYRPGRALSKCWASGTGVQQPRQESLAGLNGQRMAAYGRTGHGPLPQVCTHALALILHLRPPPPIQVAGTSFFPALLGDSRRREAADVAAAGWRAAGMSQLKPFERLTMKQVCMGACWAACVCLLGSFSGGQTDLQCWTFGRQCLMLTEMGGICPSSIPGKRLADPVNAPVPTVPYMLTYALTRTPLLPPRQAFAALPPPASSMTIDVEASTSGTSISSSGSSAAEAPRPPKTPAGSGVVHICEVNACRLPPTDFFQRGSGGGGGGGGAGGGGGGRSSSAPSSRSR